MDYVLIEFLNTPVNNKWGEVVPVSWLTDTRKSEIYINKYPCLENLASNTHNVQSKIIAKEDPEPQWQVFLVVALFQGTYALCFSQLSAFGLEWIQGKKITRAQENHMLLQVAENAVNTDCAEEILSVPEIPIIESNTNRDLELEKKLQEINENCTKYYEQMNSLIIKNNAETSLKIDGLSNRVSQLHEKIDSVIQALQPKSVIIDFETKYKLSLPFQTVEEFKAFDELLRTEEDIKCDFQTCLSFLHTEKSITTAGTIIFKKFFHKDLAVNEITMAPSKKYTIILSRTVFGNMIVNFIITYYATKHKRTLLFSDVQSELGKSIGYAPDWYGRKRRSNGSAKDKENNSE